MEKNKIRALVISDIHNPDQFSLTNLESIDLIITLGDISSDIIDYIYVMAKKIPIIGVLGNHDPEEIVGFNSIHCKVVEYYGYKFAGFGGARAYKDHPNHYTDKYVEKMMGKIPPVDIFISHAPPLVFSLKEDNIHKGFKAFDDYIEKNEPLYWFHGHLGNFYQKEYKKTKIIGIDMKRFINII